MAVDTSCARRRSRSTAICTRARVSRLLGPASVRAARAPPPDRARPRRRARARRAIACSRAPSCSVSAAASASSAAPRSASSVARVAEPLGERRGFLRLLAARATRRADSAWLLGALRARAAARPCGASVASTTRALARGSDSRIASATRDASCRAASSVVELAPQLARARRAGAADRGPPCVPGSHTAPRASTNALPPSSACTWPSSVRTHARAGADASTRRASASGSGSPRCSSLDRVERQQEQRAGVRAGVPRADRVGGRAVAHEHGVHRVAEELLDEQRATPGRRAMKSESGPSTAPSPNRSRSLQQPRRGRRESDAVALELLERVHASLQRRQRLVGAEQLGARERLALARLAIGRRVPPPSRSPRVGRGFLRASTSACSSSCSRCAGRERIVELRLLLGERMRALAHLVELARGALAIVLHAPRAILQLAQLALGALHRRRAPRRRARRTSFSAS